MKRILCIATAILVSAGLKAQPANNPLPSNPDTLRILAIGNSFSDDGTEYLPSLLEAAGIHNVIVARLYIGGCTLQRHCKEYESAGKDYIYYKSTKNVWETVSKEATILDGLKDEPWDIVTLQQASGYSGKYDSFVPWLPKLIDIVRKEISNPKASIVWHETWAYATNSVHGQFKDYNKDQNQMYKEILECVAKLKADYNIPVVIPCGDAVQLARGTRLNNSGKVPADSKVYDLTRDGFHLSRQYGRYLAACTWFEALIRPTLGKSVKGNPYCLLDTEYSIPAKDAKLCQKCAVKAVKAL